jgi:hypothetical protein
MSGRNDSAGVRARRSFVRASAADNHFSSHLIFILLLLILLLR